MSYCNHSSFVSLIEDYLRLTGACPDMFGREAASHAGFIADMRNGAELADSAVNAVLDYVCADLTHKIQVQSEVRP